MTLETAAFTGQLDVIRVAARRCGWLVVVAVSVGCIRLPIGFWLMHRLAEHPIGFIEEVWARSWGWINPRFGYARDRFDPDQQLILLPPGLSQPAYGQPMRMTWWCTCIPMWGAAVAAMFPGIAFWRLRPGAWRIARKTLGAAFWSLAIVLGVNFLYQLCLICMVSWDWPWEPAHTRLSSWRIYAIYGIAWAYSPVLGDGRGPRTGRWLISFVKGGYRRIHLDKRCDTPLAAGGRCIAEIRASGRLPE